MAKIVSIAIQNNPTSLQDFETLNPKDLGLVDEFQLDSVYDFTSNNIELHLYSKNNIRITSQYDYTFAKKLDTGDADSTSESQITSVLSINPIEDAARLGYEERDVKVLYHFLDDLFSTDELESTFFVKSISKDRREIFALSKKLSDEVIVNTVNQIQATINDSIYFFDFRLNFGNNDLFIGLNINTYILDGQLGIRIKLYEPLPTSYSILDSFTVQEKVSDSVLFEVDSEVTPTTAEETTFADSILDKPSLDIYTDEEKLAFSPKPNFDTRFNYDFNSSLADGSSFTSDYFSLEELEDIEVTGSYYEAWSNLGKKGIDLNIDYSDFNNFIHFGSAEERIINFKYKLDQISEYETNIRNLKSGSLQTTEKSGSINYYQGLLKSIFVNFDHYDRHLFFESGSTSWPKSSNSKPHTNLLSSNPTAITFYNSLISSASSYDVNNNDILTNFLPVFLREDPANEKALTYSKMIGHHFDNIWIYTNAVTDKYDNDNRLNFGISRELAADILRNFGVRIFNSADTQKDFFKLYTADAYDSGSIGETINFLQKPSDVDSSKLSVAFNDYKGEVYKRIYHNLPLLLKSKGTIKALRALISAFGVPTDLLEVKQYGGGESDFGQVFALDDPNSDERSKIRLEDDRLIIPGSSLSSTRSVRRESQKYQPDTNNIEIGYSINGSFDSFIKDNVGENFKIDNYIGNPSIKAEQFYDDLDKVRENLLAGIQPFNVKDFTRLIKFYDTTLFKAATEYIPARANVETGIIIRPDLLDRSKIKLPDFAATDTVQYSGSISIGTISGGTPLGHEEGLHNYTSSYISYEQTPDGLARREYTNTNVGKYDGELSGSIITLTTGEANIGNTFKKPSEIPYKFSFTFISSSDEITFISGSVSVPPPPPPPPAFVIAGDTTATPFKNPVDGTIVVNTQPVNMNLLVNGGTGAGAFTTASLQIGIAGLDIDSYATIIGSASSGNTEVFTTVIDTNGDYIYRVTITDRQGTILNQASISGSV